MVYLGFEIREPFFFPAPAPLQLLSLSLSPLHPLPPHPPVTIDLLWPVQPPRERAPSRVSLCRSLSHALSLSPLHPLPPHPPATVDHLRPPVTTSGQCNHHASEPPPFCVSLSRGLFLTRALSLRCTHCHHTLRPPLTTSGHLRPLLNFFPTIVVLPFLQGKFLTRFCFIFHFVYIILNFDYCKY